mgnify:FL=1
MQKLTEMQTSMQKEPLPVTRTEFETVQFSIEFSTIWKN